MIRPVARKVAAVAKDEAALTLYVVQRATLRAVWTAIRWLPVVLTLAGCPPLPPVTAPAPPPVCQEDVVAWRPCPDAFAPGGLACVECRGASGAPIGGCANIRAVVYCVERAACGDARCRYVP